MSVLSESVPPVKLTTQQDAKIHVRIQPTRGWQSLNLGELWRYRDLLWFMTVRNIKGRYRQMAFGPLWIVIRPVTSMILYSLVFGELAQLPSNGLPYPLFAYAALLPWNYFAGLANGTSSSLTTNMH